VDDDPWRFHDGQRFTIGGYEFDFLAVDDVGNVAMFSHAGWGPIPRSVVDRWLEATEAVDAVDELPATTAAVEVPKGPGDYTDWLTKVERGLFAYDWHDTYGPYRLVAAPQQPRHIDSMPTLRAYGDLVVLRTTFAMHDTIDFSSLGINVVEYPRHSP